MITLLKVIILPIILYSCFILLRIKGIQPPAEAELGDFITAVNFLFGGSIAYFLHIGISVKALKSQIFVERLYWLLIGLILFLFAFDEVYMIHETIAHHYNTKEFYVMGVYGIILFSLLALNISRLSKIDIIFLLLFIITGIVSVSVDAILKEGTITILSSKISYEQQLESVGALFLSCSIVTQAYSILARNANVNVSFGDG
jgi:uncharacterized membrane protein